MSPPDLPTISTGIVEGVGSDVIVCVCILLAGLILVAAWLSTYVPQDMRPIAVFVFENIARVRNSATGATSADASVSTDATQSDAAAPATEETTANAESNATAAVQSSPLGQDPLPAAAADSHSNIANYDVDMLESDGELDAETRERVADVLHEYTQVMEASSESELRNRQLKYFNCLLPRDSPDANADSAAGTSTNSIEPDDTVTLQPGQSLTTNNNPNNNNYNNNNNDNNDNNSSNDNSNDNNQLSATDTEPTIATSGPTSPLAAAPAAGESAASSNGASIVNGNDYRPPGSLLLKLKYFNDDLRTVFASPTELISTFKQRHFHSELSRNMNIRLIYNGRELKEGTDRTLASYAIPEEATIHCLVTERTEEAAQPEDSGNQLDGQGDIGNYMFPLFGGILGLIWYCRVCYKAYFNFMSTMALGAVTLLFFAAFFASWSSRSLRQTGQIQVHRINLDAVDSRQTRSSSTNAATSSLTSAYG